MSNHRFTVLVPASTSNLGSGFDTVSAALALYLKVTVEGSTSPGLQWISGWEAEEDNILDLALRTTCRELGQPVPSVRLSMENPIPLQRGLGSSGAAIIAGIKIAEKLAGVRLTPDEILAIAYPLEGHPDNLAASLYGGWVLSRSRGKEVRAEQIRAILECSFVLAVPEITISTQEARAILPRQYELSQVVHNLQRCALLVHALYSGKKELVSEALQDEVHQPYRAGLIPGLNDLLRRRHLPEAISSHLLGVSISGSGSSVLSLADGSFDPIGEWMVSTLRRNGTGSSYLVLDLDTKGARIEEE